MGAFWKIANKISGPQLEHRYGRTLCLAFPKFITPFRILSVSFELSNSSRTKFQHPGNKDTPFLSSAIPSFEHGEIAWRTRKPKPYALPVVLPMIRQRHEPGGSNPHPNLFCPQKPHTAQDEPHPFGHNRLPYTKVTSDNPRERIRPCLTSELWSLCLSGCERMTDVAAPEPWRASIKCSLR